MRITYKILWIENEEDWRVDAEDLLREFLRDLGFSLVVVPFEGGDEEGFKSLVERGFQEYDLILVDFGLKNDEKGSALINRIREQQVYTEIVFYSQDYEEMENECRNLGLEGIYKSRRADSDFSPKVKKVLLSSLRKVQSISSLRGLVMAETSEIDNFLHEIIECFLSSADESAIQLIKKEALEKLNNSANSNQKQIIVYGADSVAADEVLRSKLIDADKRVSIASKILMLNGLIGDERQRKQWAAEIKEKILLPRNQLAHSTEISNRGVTILKTWNGDKEFDHNAFVEIRRTFLTILEDVETKKNRYCGNLELK